MTAFLKRYIADPYLLALILTVVLAAVLPVRGQAAAAFEHLVTAAIALLFFLYGARLSPKAIGAGLLHWRLQSLVFASTYVLFPLAGLALAFLARGHVSDELLTGFLFLSVLPSTVQSSIAFTSIARGNVAAALTSASVSNLIGVVLSPVLVALVLGAESGGFDAQSVLDIALQILLPFAAGQLARPLIGPTLHRHAKLTSYVDRGSILLVVYAAFSKGMVAGVWSGIGGTDLVLVIVLNLALLAVMLALTAALGRVLGFERADRITIIFCGSKKSMATGIPMAGILFAGHGVSLIVLPLMIFHQIQLFACAVLAQKFAREQSAPAQA